MRSLLRSILRAHRSKLDGPMRELGDRYVLKEFRDHAKVSDPAKLAAFEGAWTRYLAQLGEAVGKPLSEGEIDAMSDEQRHKLLDLRLNSRGGGS